MVTFQAWYIVELVLNQGLGYLTQELNWSILTEYGPKEVGYSAEKSPRNKPLTPTQLRYILPKLSSQLG